jgi:hypothetical protein
MPKKKPGMTPEEQSEAFKREAQRLIDAGELNPIEADRLLEKAVDNSRHTAEQRRPKQRPAP